MPRKFGPALTIDIETSIKTSFKRKANPFDPANEIVYIGWASGDDPAKMFKFPEGGMPPGWFGAMINKFWPRLLVGVNIKFDLLYLLRDQRDLDAYMEWVVAGGNLWDCQLVEYLLNGMKQSEHMVSLDELSRRYGGTTKVDEVKDCWEKGIETRDIDQNTIKVYLIGDDDHYGDIGNTRLVFKEQLERARAVGQVKSILLNNGSLLCTIEMERNGMAVDKERGRVIAEALEEQIAALVVELVGYLPDDLPFDFNWGSAAQKSALIFGGEVRYSKWTAHLDEDGNQIYPMKDELHYLGHDGNTYPVEQVDADGGPEKWNLQTFKSGKNAGEYKTKKVKVPNLDKPKGAQQDYWYTFPGYTKPEKRWATSTPGQYSTGADIIEELGSRDIPFLKALAKRTSLSKDLTTYYITTNDKGEEVGMLTLVQWDGIIHHMLNHTSTVTGRFSSSNPNLQNLPKGNKSEVKTIFVSRFEGGKVIQSDFTSLEVYVQAILTRCKQLIKDLLDGLDMHCQRVSQKEGISYEEALKLCKGYIGEDGVRVPAVPEWEYKRSKAKIFSFQRAYGAGASKIALTTGMAIEEVEALIAGESARYPEIDAFNENLIQHLENTARPLPKNGFVQHPDIPGLTCLLKEGYWRAPDNKLYCWRQQPAPKWLAERPASKGGVSSSFSPTEVKNYPVQGTGGEWMKAAMWLLVREFYRRKNWQQKGLLVNSVHDAAYADAAPEVAVEVAAVVHACMEEASTFMEYYFGWNVPVPVPSDTTWGPSMGEDEKLPDGWDATVPGLRAEIRERYMGSYKPSFERTSNE